MGVDCGFKGGKMRIAIDLDNTLFYNDIVDNITKEYGIPPTKHYDLRDLPPVAREKCFCLFNDEEAMHGLKPYDMIAEKLQEWVDDGNVIKFDDGYGTQDALYKNRLKDRKALYDYFVKEFIEI